MAFITTITWVGDMVLGWGVALVLATLIARVTNGAVARCIRRCAHLDSRWLVLGGLAGCWGTVLNMPSPYVWLKGGLVMLDLVMLAIRTDRRHAKA